MNNDIVYLDNSSTTQPYDKVIDIVSHINKYTYGNPSSLHKMGSNAEKLIKTSRETIANILDTSPKEINFTSGGTEANNLAIRGFLNANKRNGSHIIASAVEHPSVLNIYKALSQEGFIVDYVNVDNNGIVNLEDLKSKINDKTSLISIMHVNNEVGSIQPIYEISKLRNSIKSNIALHVDCIQSFCKLKIIPKELGIDLLSVSSHKVHGPKGVGALFVDSKIKISPLFWGGNQEFSLRPGTENVSGIAGFGLAAKITYENWGNSYTAVSNLKTLFINKLRENLEEYKIISPENSSPYILSVGFSNLRSEVLLHHLEDKNIFVSSGSACTSKKNSHSHVLKAMNVPAQFVNGALRFSLSAFNTQEDIDYTIKSLKEILPKIKTR